MYAVPLVWCAVSPAGYYYSFLVLLILLPWRDGAADRVRLLQMALLSLLGVAAYALEIASHDALPLMHRASTLLAVYFAVWLALEYARPRALRRFTGAAAPAAGDAAAVPALPKI
jgi:hypothetical protein